jgi:anaerobic magnesium-protoporphyrin IX monomethyl ester cyclase
MRVLVGQSYFLRFDPKLFRAMQPYPPLGSLYAAAVLRERGHDVAFFDAMLATSEAEWADRLDLERPAVAVIFEDNFNYLSKMCLLRMREAAFRMLGAARARGIATIVCGSDATDHPAEYIEHGADWVVIGEGEATTADLLDALGGDSGVEPTGVVGLTFRTGGDLVTTGRRPNMTDLDALPYPAWDLVDIDRYRAAWRPHGRFSMNLATTRGCPFHCNWCAKPIWGQRYAVRSPAYVADEVAWLKRTYAPDHISFADDIFGLKPDWLEAFAAAVRERDAVIPFKCLSRADLLLRPGDVEALRDAGCETVWMGAESGSQSILDAMDKGTTVAQIREAAARLRVQGIRVAFFLQFGYPGETWQDIEATRRLVAGSLPDDIGISVSYPLPGTPFHERVRADLAARGNWVDSSDLAMLYRGPYSTGVYRRLHRVVHREFRLLQAAGTTGVRTHLGRVLARPASRARLARLKDAAVLPLDRAILAAAVRRDRSRGPEAPGGRGIRIIAPPTDGPPA